MIRLVTQLGSLSTLAREVEQGRWIAGTVFSIHTCVFI